MNLRIVLGTAILGWLIGAGCDESGSTGTTGPPPKSGDSPTQKSSVEPPASDHPVEGGR